MPKFTRANARSFGRLGGRRTVEKHGIEPMREIGRRGFAATAGKHFMGDTRKCLDQLVEWGAIEPRKPKTRKDIQ